MRECQVAFGRAEAFIGLVGVQGEVERVRVGVADVFAGDAEHPPRDGERVGTAVNHSRKPVHRAVRAGAAQRFVEGGEEFVEPVALFVQRFRLVGQRLCERGVAGNALAAQQRPFFQPADGFARVAACLVGEGGDGGFVDFKAEGGEAAPQFFREFVFAQGLEMEDAQAREQSVVEVEGGVFGGGADEDEGAVFDVGEEGVLLGFVEAVDFVDEEDGFAADGALLLGLRHGFADFFDAGEDGGEADVARVEGVGEEQGKGGFAAAGRPPEEHGEGFFLRDGNGERHAVAENVALADVVGEGFRAQAVGERGVAVAGKERGLAAHEVLWLWWVGLHTG